MPAPSSPAEAAKLARTLVEPLGDRWAHVRAVAARVTELLPAVPLPDRGPLVSAAWLHDIGYAPEIATTGFHPLDGARHLRRLGWPDSVVNLVVHHSGARFEAAERGLTRELAAFPMPEASTLDALDTADLTTGPRGDRVGFAERITEILERYPAAHPVHRTWTRAAPVLRESVTRTETRMAAQPR
ncbi:HD domain-containing protein [Amycolatopsis sp. NPDC051758]|uniref:HD domain-containing protein n=1 Tax=Amycolatopsis sp. NPDC051758 TaxID=3363935 RepID=UPI00378DC635